MPVGVEESIEQGMYLFCQGAKGDRRVQLMGSGAIFREVIAAEDLLAKDFKVEADVWSVLGINQLHREAMLVEDWNRKHPQEKKRRSYVEEALQDFQGPVVISSDYVQAYPEQLRRGIAAPLTVLGTDGFGRSDSREKLRRFFGVDRHHIVVAALQALAGQKQVRPATVKQAIEKYGIDTEAPHSMSR